MKKLLIILLATLISGSIFPQKIKIEKKTGIMSIDNIDVSRFSSSKNADKQDVYSFTDFHSDDFVSLIMIRLSKDEEIFLQVTSSLSDKTSEMDFDLVNVTLNTNSAISNLIVKKYNFFTPEGMNKEVIVQFLSLENKKHSQAHARATLEQQAGQDKINAFAPSLKNALTVINKNTKEEIILIEDPSGRFNRYKDSSTDYANFIIKDHKGNVVAVIKKEQTSSAFPAYFIETYDKETYPLGKVTPSNIPVEAAKKLVLNDYLGNGEKSPEHIQQLKVVAQAARKEEALAKTEDYNRRVYVNGILILEDGKVLEGQFMTEFRETADGIVLQPGHIISLDGKTLTHYYKNDKGKDKIKIYDEKQIRSFKITKEGNPDYDEYYLKIEYLQLSEKADVIADDALNVVGLGKNLLLNKPKKKKALVYRAADMPKTTLYFSGNKIFIQDKKNNKTVELSKSEYEAQLKEIASDCPAIIENIENQKYKLDRSSIYYFITDYNHCN
jgi:hypothetical protein